MASSVWKIWIDTGGTFTDCISVSPSGNLKRLKILSNSSLRGRVVRQISKTQIKVDIHWPLQRDIFEGFTIIFHGKKTISRNIKSVDLLQSVVTLDSTLPPISAGSTLEITSHEEVPVLATRLLTETSLLGIFPFVEMKLGSTRGTNAILERKGARTAFITTKGFKDLLLIGNQQRPDLFALHIQKVKPLYEIVIEAKERTASDGEVIAPLSNDEIKKIIGLLKKAKIESVAIAFVNSYKNPSHEMLLKKALVMSGFEFTSASHELSHQIKILPRAETCVANAYLAPIIHRYLQKIKEGLKGADLKVMTSAGGLVPANDFHPKESLLSGPAGGVVGAAATARLSNIDKLITFDMGGTSTDVSLYNNRYDYRYESKVGDIKILTPSLAIETIAAGGGSICDFDGYRFVVGPRSAGAYPGPACYGAGGPLTITDVNLLLGRIDADQFAIPIHLDKAQWALEELTQRIKAQTKRLYKAGEILESFIQIANEKMAEAIKKISIREGHNPSDYTLLSFGGAGGQHACALASMMSISKVMIPYDAGLLSAYGIGHARIERFEEQLVLQSLLEVEDTISTLFENLVQRAIDYFEQSSYNTQQVVQDKSFVFLRFHGQESTIEIEYTPGVDLRREFKKKYEAIFGHWLNERAIEIESIRALLYVPGYVSAKGKSKAKRYLPPEKKITRAFVSGRWTQVPFYVWEDLKPGGTISGPAVITSQNSTTVLEVGWVFLLDENNNGIIEHQKNIALRREINQEALLELFSNRFTAVAQEMGAVLQRTSFSVNVKERLDFSCAVLDSQGYLIVNAPHIPVHLGSLGVCVREVKKVIDMKEGDIIITNHPGYGGSHLPDVTLIKPVFFKKKLIGYVANRAHHAEIGGKRPGSMPADATLLEEEGVIISPTWLIRQHQAQWDEIKKMFTGATYPTRSLDENMADLRGALASVNFGEAGLRDLCEKYGDRSVTSYMDALRAYSCELLSSKIKSIRGKRYKALEKLDDGSVLKVVITTARGKMKIDFSGTSDIHKGNLNATRAIVQSVVLYVLRLWVNQPIAMNEGLMEPVKLILPRCLLNPDFKVKSKLPAVVGGNTEVSQRLTDTLLKALNLVACSQGTMNNFLFGNERFGYYETICGGTGAGNGFDGRDAVHSHMTNTRITDPEILELRYPVCLERFEIRKGSGGKGLWTGGEGIAREFLFHEDVEVSILSQHRKERPYGQYGGSAGKTGEQYLITAAGKKKKIGGMESLSVKAGERIVIKTPGGGGWRIKKPRKAGLS